MSGPPPMLDYAPPMPWHRKRGRPLIILLLIVAAVVTAWRPAVGVVRRLRGRAQVASLVRGLREDAPPAGTVAFEQDPVQAARLVTNWAEYGSFVLPFAPTRAGAVRIPHAVRRFYMDRGNAILFVHERSTPGGLRRLVLVEGRVSWKFDYTQIGGYQSYGFCRLTLRTTTYSLDVPWGTPPRPCMTTTADPDVFVAYPSPGKPPDLRIYAGQSDPADPARFTIDVSLYGETRTIDGRLVDAIMPGGTESVDLLLRPRSIAQLLTHLSQAATRPASSPASR